MMGVQNRRRTAGEPSTSHSRREPAAETCVKSSSAPAHLTQPQPAAPSYPNLSTASSSSSSGNQTESLLSYKLASPKPSESAATNPVGYGVQTMTGQGAYSRVQHALAAANTTLTGNQSLADLTQPSSSGYGHNPSSDSMKPAANGSNISSSTSDKSPCEYSDIHTYIFMHIWSMLEV